MKRNLVFSDELILVRDFYDYKGFKFAKLDNSYVVFSVEITDSRFNLYIHLKREEWSTSKSIKEIKRRINNMLRNPYWGLVEEIWNGTAVYGDLSILNLATEAKAASDYEKLLRAFEEKIEDIIADKLMDIPYNTGKEQVLCHFYELITTI